MDEATKEAFAELTQGMERGFAAVSEDFTGLREDITSIREDITGIQQTTATKDDLAALRTELKGDVGRLGVELKADIASLREQTTGIEQELKSIRVDLNEVVEKLANIAGYRKEIDHAFERIAAIEKHLGIYKRSAA